MSREARSSSITSCPVESCKITLVTKHLKMVNLMMLEKTTRCLCRWKKGPFLPLYRGFKPDGTAHSGVQQQPFLTQLDMGQPVPWPAAEVCGAQGRAPDLVLKFGCWAVCHAVCCGDSARCTQAGQANAGQQSWLWHFLQCAHSPRKGRGHGLL